jgi:putative tryptophan/tyrosine transport system substrate-binding protein
LLDRRRIFVSLAASAVLGPRRTFAQSRVPRVGLVTGGPHSSGVVLQGLREAGYVLGHTIIVEHRQTEGLSERYGPAVESVLKTGVDVLVVTSTHGLTAAHMLTRSVPIVAIDLETDPVASGFVASLARPGGNVTGFFLDLPEMSGKLVQLLKEAVPRLTRVAVLWDRLSRALSSRLRRKPRARAASRSTRRRSGSRAISRVPLMAACGAVSTRSLSSPRPSCG